MTINGTNQVKKALVDKLHNNLSTQKPFLLLIQGLPGSGKTTLAKELSERFGIPYFEADQFFTDSAGNYQFDIDLLSEAHSVCKWNCIAKLSYHNSCICSNTFTSDKELNTYYMIAQSFGVEVILVRLNSQFESIHNVPEKTIDKMRNRMLKSLTISPNFILN